MAIDFKAMNSKAALIGAVGLCLAVALSGCGRRGSLEAPRAASPSLDPAVAASPEPTPQKSGFILDALI
ncbi:LPS translocon maturation chaperone LptM [Roseibium sp.]|uniref:LPS translocon maturation chaperone LptM n=1 Tax=Roseibium sp. TaxID=1936156 RepID=UPI003A96A051